MQSTDDHNALLQQYRDDLDMAQLRMYFALFDQEAFFDEILSRLT